MTSVVLARLGERPVAEQKPYRPVGGARTLWASRAPEVVISGPAGTGKSRGALEKLHACACIYPGMRGLIVRKTRESLTQSALVTFEEQVLVGTGIKLHHERQEYPYPNGSSIVVGGLDKASKVMSTEYDLIYVNEATELTQDDWEALLTRNRYGVLPYQQVLGDCNPDAPSHWIMERAKAGQLRLIESRHEDNPVFYDQQTGQWTERGRAYIAKLDALTGYRYQRLRLGLWVAAEGMYFHEWNPAVHVCAPFDPPNDWTKWLAVDYGFADPWCVLGFARTPDRKQIYVYREIYASGYRDEQQAEIIKERFKGERIVRCVGDPSMFNRRTEQDKPSIALVYQQHGVPLLPGINNRIAGWQTVRRALAHDDEQGVRPRLQVMEGRAPNLVRTLPQMVHDPLDPEDLADAIKGAKTEDHAVDCLRYGLMLEAVPEQGQRAREVRWA